MSHLILQFFNSPPPSHYRNRCWSHTVMHTVKLYFPRNLESSRLDNVPRGCLKVITYEVEISSVKLIQSVILTEYIRCSLQHADVIEGVLDLIDLKKTRISDAWISTVYNVNGYTMLTFDSYMLEPKE